MTFMTSPAEYIISQLKDDYLAIRELPDGSVAAIGRLITTTAIYTGMSINGWGDRFCFADHSLAVKRFHDLQSEDDVPEGFIARR